MASPIMVPAGGGVYTIAKGSMTTGVRRVAEIRYLFLVVITMTQIRELMWEGWETCRGNMAINIRSMASKRCM